MSEVQIDGFRFSEWAGGRRLLIVESDRLEQCVEYCNDRRIEWLHVSPYHGYKLWDVNFLARCSGVTGIHFQGGFDDWSGLYRVEGLRQISTVFAHDVDFSRLPNLIDVATDWSSTIEAGLFSSASLTRLWLRGYKHKRGGIGRIQELSHLADLSIVQSNLTSLAGIERLGALTRLVLAYCPRLTDVSPLRHLGAMLKELEIDHCKHAVDAETLRRLTALRKVILSDCGQIDGLAFVADLPLLEFLSFVNTTVVDGDLAPCLSLRFCGFMNKRHYSHTFDEMREAIRKRWGARSLYPD